MSRPDSTTATRRPTPVARYAMVVLVGGAVVLLIYILTFHATRLPPTAPVSRGTSRQSGNELAAVRESLRRDNDFTSCRNALTQLNSHLARFPDVKKPAPLSDAEREVLKQFQLDDDEINEVSNQTFTPLDEHYLDLCFLLQDAARPLDLEGVADRERAAAAFAWAMRQVRLRESEQDACPPQFVLRRGWGSPLERSLVFLALLDQLGIPGCMVALPGEGKEPRFWAPGALAGGEIYLFDTRLGLPLPGPAPGEILTLAQLRTRPDALASLPASNERPYDVTTEQARRAELHIAVALSALSPRMRYLSEEVQGGSNKAHLACDAAALLQAFKKATDRPEFVGSTVRFWAVPRTGNSSLRVLRTFLTPGEGGVDRQLDPGKRWVSRRRRFVESLVPWQLMPASVQSLPTDVDPGARLHSGFAMAFTELLLGPQMQRDKMLRGHLQEATAGLVDRRDQLQRLRTWIQAEDDPQGSLLRWLDEARKAQADLLIAEDQAKRNKTPESLAAVKAAQVRVDSVWQKEKSERPLRIFEGTTVPALFAETGYLLALCKHEQAEQAQAAVERRKGPATPKDREGAVAAWRDAASRWKEYIEDPAGARDEAAARLLWARALEKQGDRVAARDILANPPPRTSPWEKITFRIRLQQLEGGNP